MKREKRILVLGIGNILWADEGFGVRAVEALHRRFRFPPQVRLMDGGTQGLYLLEYVEWATHLIVFDAVDYRLPPGTLHVVLDDEVPVFLGASKMSLHQTGFQEVLACARLHDRYPEKLVLIGVQPMEIEDFGGSLRDLVKARIEPAIAEAVRHLNAWGVTAEPADTEATAAQRLNPPGVDLAAYESQRPSARYACRIGDPRFLPITDGE